MSSAVRFLPEVAEDDEDETQNDAEDYDYNE